MRRRTRRVQHQEAAEQSGAMARTNQAYDQQADNTKEAERNEKERARIHERLNHQAERRANQRLPDWDDVQRRQIGEEFSMRSMDEGTQWSPDQVQQAAGFIQGQMGQGVDMMTAMQQAFMGLMQQAQQQQAMTRMLYARNSRLMGGSAMEQGQAPTVWGSVDGY